MPTPNIYEAPYRTLLRQFNELAAKDTIEALNAYVQVADVAFKGNQWDAKVRLLRQATLLYSKTRIKQILGGVE